MKTCDGFLIISCILFIVIGIYCKNELKIVLLRENKQPEVASWFNDAIKDYELRHNDLILLKNVISIDRNDEAGNIDKFCSILSEGVSIIFDMTWRDWTAGKKIIEEWNIPYIKSQISSTAIMLQGIMDVLEERNAFDIVMIFQNENDMDQFLYNIIGKYMLRIMTIVGLDDSQSQNIKKLKSTPDHFVLFGDSVFNQESYRIALENKLVKLSDRWILVFTDFNYLRFDTSILQPSSTLITVKFATGCEIQNLENTCFIQKDFQVHYFLMINLVDFALNKFVDLKIYTHKPIIANCNKEPINNVDFKLTLEQSLRKNNTFNNNSLLYWNKEREGFYLRTYYNLQILNKTLLEDIANWHSGEKINVITGKSINSPKKFYRIGITEAIPWTYQKTDALTGKPLFTASGEPVYEGYCIDLIKKMAKDMNFNYELVTPNIGTFGKQFPNGTWTGVIGDLVKGDTDMIIAALLTSSQREKYIDFVSPHFEQTGISIVIRKPLHEKSLFQFMTVMKIEAWLSIVIGVILLSILLTVLNKYSPYSARNNIEEYIFPCRDFTLKESFWFALTTFTPKGSGETPRPISCQTLTATYFMFVVLTMATFTSNLAAWITIEGISDISITSLEQLSSQSRISYTVVKKSMAHEYFINMKNAEDLLYKKWKELTLNSTSEDKIYNVWDYPVKETYGRILLAVNASNPVDSAKVGFRKVKEHYDGDFAFIHDSSEIKYEVTRDCNISEIGDTFGERPYAIAVQQGSKIQEELSYELTVLQHENFFEDLKKKYWNYSIRGVCNDVEEIEGIQLENLAGIFYVTLFGILIAIPTLLLIFFIAKEKILTRKVLCKLQEKKIIKNC